MFFCDAFLWKIEYPVNCSWIETQRKKLNELTFVARMYENGAQVELIILKEKLKHLVCSKNNLLPNEVILNFQSKICQRNLALRLLFDVEQLHLFSIKLPLINGKKLSIISKVGHRISLTDSLIVVFGLIRVRTIS